VTKFSIATGKLTESIVQIVVSVQQEGHTLLLSASSVWILTGMVDRPVAYTRLSFFSIAPINS
jgi:hypothetical protein